MWDLCALTRDWTCVPCVARQTPNHWTTREVSKLCFILSAGLVPANLLTRALVYLLPPLKPEFWDVDFLTVGSRSSRHAGKSAEKASRTWQTQTGSHPTQLASPRGIEAKRECGGGVYFVTLGCFVTSECDPVKVLALGSVRGLMLLTRWALGWPASNRAWGGWGPYSKHEGIRPADPEDPSSSSICYSRHISLCILWLLHFSFCCTQMYTQHSLSESWVARSCLLPKINYM